MQVREAVIPDQAEPVERPTRGRGEAGKGLNGFCLSTSHQVPV